MQGTGTFKITVNAPTLTISCPPNQTATTCVAITAVSPTAAGGCAPYTYTMTGAPAGVSINVDDTPGRIGGTPTKTGTFNARVTVTDEEETTASCTFRIKVSCPTLTVGGLSNVTVTEGQAMSTLTATASGGTPPYGFTMANAPAGVNINVDDTPGKIGGTPTEMGTFNVTVTVTSGCGCMGTGKFKIVVKPPCDPVAIETISDVRVTVGDSVNLTATVNQGCPPVTLSMTGAPSTVKLGDVTVGPSTTRKWPIAGPAVQPGSYDVTLTATDSHDPVHTDEERFTITVACLPLTLGYISDLVAQKGVAISAIQARASGGCTPLKYTLSSNPNSGSGLSIGESSGRMTGTPTAVDTFAVTVKVTDASDASKSRSFEMRVTAPLSVDAPDVWEAVDVPILSVFVTASGGQPPYRYSMSGGPLGLSLNATTGEFTGEVEEADTWNATVTVTDADRRSKSAGITIEIYLPGDFNGDGRRDAADAKLFNTKLGLRRSDAGYDRRMDLNRDGIINYADFVILSGYIERDASSGSSG